MSSKRTAQGKQRQQEEAEALLGSGSELDASELELDSSDEEYASGSEDEAAAGPSGSDDEGGGGTAAGRGGRAAGEPVDAEIAGAVLDYIQALRQGGGSGGEGASEEEDGAEESGGSGRYEKGGCTGGVRRSVCCACWRAVGLPLSMRCTCCRQACPAQSRPGAPLKLTAGHLLLSLL